MTLFVKPLINSNAIHDFGVIMISWKCLLRFGEMEMKN